MSRRLSATDWLWNTLLYPVAYVAIAATTTLVSVTFRGVDETPQQQGYFDLAFGRTLGMLLYGSPALAVSLAMLAIGFRIAPHPAHRLLAVTVPLATFTVWVLIIGRGGLPIFLTSAVGVAISVLVFVGLGLATRVPHHIEP